MTKQILTVLALTISSLPLYAADTMDVQWNQLCRQTDLHEVAITTATGETVKGYCMMIDVNQVSINVGGSPVRVARANITKLLMMPRAHQLSSLGKGVRGGLKFGFNALLSPAAVVGAIAIPATLAWGAVSTPFCLLGDLKAKLTPDKEIRIK